MQDAVGRAVVGAEHEVAAEVPRDAHARNHLLDRAAAAGSALRLGPVEPDARFREHLAQRLGKDTGDDVFHDGE